MMEVLHNRIADGSSATMARQDGVRTGSDLPKEEGDHIPCMMQ